MYAVIRAGAHQYKVSPGDTLCIDFHAGNSGDSLTFDEVLMVQDSATVVGAPLVKGAKVEAVIKRQRREDKIIVFKFKRRKNYKKKQGHRQQTTEIEIKKIHA